MPRLDNRRVVRATLESSEVNRSAIGGGGTTLKRHQGRWSGVRRLCGLLAVAAAFVSSFSGCVTAYKDSLGGKELRTFHRIFYTDFDTAWQSVLDGLKHARLDVSSREAGLVQTLWTDNTAEKNFVDSFGSQDSYLKAQFRVRVTVAKGFFNGRPSVKVTVQKEQIIQRDVLEGWTPVDSDSIDENTLLYRIGRLIAIRGRQNRLEQERTKAQMDQLQF